MKQKISVRALIKRDGKIFLARRSNGRPSILGKYELPGGSIEFKEQPADALKRYIGEQLGGEVATSQLFDVVSFIDPDDAETQYVFILYLVSLTSKTFQLSSRYDKYIWQELKNIQRNELTNSSIMLLGITEVNEPYSSIEPKLEKNDVNIASEYMTIYSDGGSRGNPGPSASAFVITNRNEEVVADGGVYLGITTNNQAEYQAVYQALKKAVELDIKYVDFRMDSSLVVNQLNGIYKIKNRDLWPIHEQIKDLLPYFHKISFSHVRREFNQMADGLVNKILDEHDEKHV